MTKEAKTKISSKIPANFWKGLIAGIILAVAGVFLYLKFYPSVNLPPTNSSLNECKNNCQTKKGACLLQCGTGDQTCLDRCDNAFKICTMRCYPR